MQNNKNQELEELKAALEAAEQRFRTFLRLSSEFYWETDAQHHLAEPRDPMLEAAWRAHRSVLEAQLPEGLSAQEVYDNHEVMMLHGQRCCYYRAPACHRCVVYALCPTGQRLRPDLTARLGERPLERPA
jgi:hypothetical protein